MATTHNQANIGDIAKTVIMPGDPLRAKKIAQEFLDDYKLVNQARGIYAYTGTYKGKKLTVMASGMGMPSMGIYSYELFKYYDVENIIRIGSCGGYASKLNLFDIILSENVFTEGNYALTLNNENCHIVSASVELNSIIESTAETNIIKGNTICGECFDAYMTDVNKFLSRVPEGFNPISAEMEAFSLFYNAKLLNKKAACLMTVVDLPLRKDISVTVSAEERQNSLNKMIKIALDSAIKL